MWGSRPCLPPPRPSHNAWRTNEVAETSHLVGGMCRGRCEMAEQSLGSSHFPGTGRNLLTWQFLVQALELIFFLQQDQVRRRLKKLKTK